MTNALTEKLTPLRGQIDAIDDQLISLLKERIGIVHQVGEAKRAALGDDAVFLRSGREGSMIRRMYDAFKDSDFNALAATSMWRQIIGASIHHESPLSISVYYHESLQALYWLAREHFGKFIPITMVTSPSRVLGDIYEKRANVGALPMPGPGYAKEEDGRWWRLIDHTRPDDTPKIFAALPLASTTHYPKRFPSALALAIVTPEPSGDDLSYFTLSVDDTVSTSRLSSAFDTAKLNITIIDMDQSSGMRHVLVTIPGFHDGSDSAFDSIRGTLDEALHQMEWLGTHPAMISASE